MKEDARMKVNPLAGLSRQNQRVSSALLLAVGGCVLEFELL